MFSSAVMTTEDMTIVYILGKIGKVYRKKNYS